MAKKHYDAGLYTADGKRIIKEEEEKINVDFDGFMNLIKTNHPLQWLNMMATNIDMLIKEYNEVAFNLGETIIAAVFVDSSEKEYETYREILSPALKTMEDAHVKNEDNNFQEQGDDRDGTGGDIK